jgi:HSP20 family protein
MEFSKEIENTTGWWPQLDLSETDKDVLIKAELPGIDPKEVDISINGNQLSIRGEKKLEHEEKKSNYHYVERQYGSFSRSVNLPCAVLQDKVDANYKDGVLTITLPKDAAHQPKRITVHNG